VTAFSNLINQIICGSAERVLKLFPDDSIDCVVTSPPYWGLRDYRVKGQLGLELTIREYIEKLTEVFDEVKRVLKSSGTCWINIGDTYYTDHRRTQQDRANPEATNQLRLIHHRAKSRELPIRSLCQIPSRLALSMTNRGWILRNEIIWHKPNCMPTSVKNRFTVDFEKMFFFVKSPRYYFDQQFESLHDRERLTRRLLSPQSKRKREYGDAFIAAINPATAEASRQRMLKLGRNKRSVWSIAIRPFAGNHFAAYPSQLIETPIKAGCPPGGIVLDPFIGSGTTALVARKFGRRFIGIDLSRDYVRMTKSRLRAAAAQSKMNYQRRPPHYASSKSLQQRQPGMDHAAGLL